MGRTKIELSLSPEQMQEFFLRVSQCKGGATGPALRALAEEFGVTISHDAANTFRTGPLADYLGRLEKNTQKARELVALAKANVPTSRANEVKLGIAISEKLDADLDEMSPEDMDRMSRINERLRASEDRSSELERRQSETAARLQLAERQLALRDEQIGKLKDDAAARAQKNAQAKAVLEVAKKKGGLTKESLQKIEEAAKLL